MKTSFNVLNPPPASAAILTLLAGPLILPLGHASAQTAQPQLIHATFHPTVSQSMLGHIGVVSTSSIPRFVIQRPVTKAKAAQEHAEAGFNWGMSEGAVERNLQSYSAAGPAGVMLAGPEVLLRSATAIGGRVYGNLVGVSTGRFRNADKVMTAMEQDLNLQDSLRTRVVDELLRRGAGPVALIQKPFPPGLETEFRRMATMMCATLAWVPAGATPDTYLAGQGMDTKLELELLRPALTGEAIHNPSLHFRLGVRARLVRLSDGLELASCALNYRGTKHKFTRWAAQDAQLFKAELEHCFDSVGRMIVDELFAQVPRVGSRESFASNTPVSAILERTTPELPNP